LADDIHGEIDRGFAGTLKIQDDRILLGLIGNEVLLVPGQFLVNALPTSLDVGGFIENDVVSHTPTRVW
jgi:hypothetical protein